jgi:hypothetical protein
MIQQKKRTAGRRDAGHSLRMWSSVSFFGTRSKPQGGTLLEESRLLEARAETRQFLVEPIENDGILLARLDDAGALPYCPVFLAKK